MVAHTVYSGFEYRGDGHHISKAAYCLCMDSNGVRLWPYLWDADRFEVVANTKADLVNALRIAKRELSEAEDAYHLACATMLGKQEAVVELEEKLVNAK